MSKYKNLSEWLEKIYFLDNNINKRHQSKVQDDEPK